jgi:hypothetical protein
VSIASSSSTRTISSKHLRIFPQINDINGSKIFLRWFVEDLGTKNGTALNGERVQPYTPIELFDGDALIMGFDTSSHVRMNVHQSRRSATLDLYIDADLNHYSGMLDSLRPQRSVKTYSEEKRKRKREIEGNRECEINGSATKMRKFEDKIGSYQEKLMVCSICIEYFQESVTLECSHTFCSLCVSNWLKKSLSCPQCRRAVGKVPIRNRALDDLIEFLAGKSSSYQDSKERRTKFLEPTKLNRPTLPSSGVWSSWNNESRTRYRAFTNNLSGQPRVDECFLIGLTESYIDQASHKQLQIAIQNLIPNRESLKTMHEMRERLKIFLFYG